MGPRLLAAMAVCAASAAALPAQANDLAQMQALMAKLAERVEALEKRNAELENALTTERLSEREPEVATRLKALEARTQAMDAPVKRMEALDGIQVEGSVTGVVQSAGAHGTASGQREGRANYRGDVAVTLPAGEWGDMKGTAFAHVRFGQGSGLSLRPTYTSTPNSVGFEVSGVGNPDSSFAILAQGWYQLDIPLPRDRATTAGQQRARVTVGKIDVFGFFDGNAIADDETTRFQNNAFVHNPLLDSGGGVGADAYGFAPGAILQYIDERDKSAGWKYALGVFGAGPGSNFSGSLGKPLVIAQVETTRRIGFLPGTYRLYAWTNGQATSYLGTAQRQQGVGFSVDQQVSDELTVFARWGRLTKGQPRFDTAVTAGAELSGNVWGRGGDALGAAWGRLRTAKAFSADSATADADGDGQADWGYRASGAETLAEFYYRWNLGNGLQFTPSFQWIRRPGGNASASAVRVLGVRAHWAF
jgi:high affinity Mn2+ porin